ncbi:MAG: VWA domain-containing protein [Clostridia bacterium]|nr:VWA domain-containing protein [Clostridia bacterium]
MKTFRRSLAACLMLCALLTLLTVGVFAEEAQDGLTVTLTTDKEAYGAGETVTAVLTVTNTNNVPMQSVTLKQLVPEGYELAEGQTDTKAVVDLGAGESVSLTVIWAPAAETQDTGFSLMKFYQNNKTLVHIVGIVLGVILLVVLVAFGIHKLRYAFISMLLCSVMLFGAVSGTVVQVQALEPVEGSIKTSVSFTADGQEKKLEAVVEYSMEPEETPEAICTVTFDTLGGSAVESQQVENGGLAVRPDVPTREGHVFVGWYADAEFENLFDFAAPITKSCTVYAYWINTEDETDTDGDGLTDELERYFGTDKEKVDTDGDGLSDYVEVMVLNYDPLKTDTDENGTTDDREDLDQDGLDNKTEIELGTDCFIADTDQDALTDKDEVETHHTDPLKSDTDGDGFLDGWEIENGTDPLSENKTLDVTETVEMLDVTATLDIHLNGEQQQSLTVENSDDSIFMNTVPGQISSALSLTMDGELPESGATLSFAVGEEFPQEVTEDFVPVIYYYNPETFLLEEVPTTYVNGVATTHLTHFSTYILLNKVLFDEVWETEIKPPDTESSGKNGVDVVFVVDSSGSMSSNDRQNIRITAVKNFIDKLGENDRAAVVDFDSKATLYQSFTGDHDALYNAINRVNASGNTNLSNGMSLALQQFMDGSYTRTDAFKYIIFLTDGQGSYSTSYTQTAADNGIVIYTVGLGSGVDANVLKGMANGTGGKYYFASEADDLIEIYDKAIEETIDYSTDSNDDGISDYYTKLLCEGKLLNGAGQICFMNFVDDTLKQQYPNMTDAEIMYAVIQQNDDYDRDGLKNGEEIVVKNMGNRVYIQGLSNIILDDTDMDGYSDMHENMYGSNPLVQDIMSSDVTWIADDGIYLSSLSAERYVNSAWYRSQLFIGNFIYGGEYNWKYAAKQQLLGIIDAYLEERAEVYEEEYKFQEKIENGWDILKSIAANIKFVDDALSIVEESKEKIEMVEKAKKLKELEYRYNMVLEYFQSLPNNLQKQQKSRIALAELTKMEDQIGSITEDLAKKLKFEKVDLNKLVKIPISPKLAKVADVGGKVAKGMVWVEAIFETGQQTAEAIDTYAKIYANIESMQEIKHWLNEIATESEVGFVKNAAQELIKEIDTQENDFCTDIGNLIDGSVSNLGPLVVDEALDKFGGPLGWAISIGKDLGNFLTGVSETTKLHIYTIASGEAGRHSATLLKKTVNADGNILMAIEEDTMKYYLLCGLARISGEEKFKEAAKAQSWLFEIINKADETVDTCEDRIDKVNEMLTKYALIR